MGKINDLRKNYEEIPLNIKWILIATLISNIGNGMNTIAISKLLYDKTGSALAFGGVILLDYVIAFGFQFISGSVVDRNNPKKVSITSDCIRGIVLALTGIAVNTVNNGIYLLPISLIIVNIVNPFYRSSNFKIVPLLVEDSLLLLKMNSIISTLLQTGQLLGVALVAPILVHLNSGWALIIDGITFLIAGLLVCFVKFNVKENQNINEKKSNLSLYKDWKEILKLIKEEKSILIHILISSGDYLAVNFINIILVPMVTLWYKNNSYCISLFDGGFAVGAIFSVVLIYKAYKIIGLKKSSWLGLMIEGLIFVGIMISRWPIITISLTFSLGLFNAYSISIFQTSLQERIPVSMKGRIGSLKNLIIYILSLIFVPIISKLVDYSLTIAIFICACIILLYSISSIIINRKKIFGENYLIKED